MLKRMGWSSGALGSSQKGLLNPINPLDMSSTSGKRCGLGGGKIGGGKGGGGGMGNRRKEKERKRGGDKNGKNRWKGNAGAFDDVLVRGQVHGEKVSKKRERERGGGGDGGGGGGAGRDQVGQLTAALVQYINQVPRPVQAALKKHLLIKVGSCVTRTCDKDVT